MFSFEYYNPTRIVFGEGQIAKLNDLVPEKARVLVLYGGGSAKRTGTLDEVKTALGSRYVVEFGGIEANPEFDTLVRAVEVIKQEKLDFLLAVGGGSVLDGSKFVAAAACFDGDPWEIVTSRGAVVKAALPLGTVLTLPATGSEMNNVGVVSRKALKIKQGFRNTALYPRFSILDPAKTLTLPMHQVANGIVDAFIHVLEQYLTEPHGAMVQDAYAEGLLRTLRDLGPQIMQQPNNLELRANMMWCATQALNGLIGVGVAQDWASHQIGHELTALYGLDHAQTLSIVLPGLWAELKDQKRDKLVQYALNVWGIRTGSHEERVSSAIAQTELFFQQMGMKTRLSYHGLDKSAVDEVVAQLEKHGQVALGEKQNITPDVARRILARRV
ncbi:iron-containing alcohol dehydrogenase [Pasteurellaceae bacterium 20609_3]|uniref:iron-containing alcohol dehydrogenase n=1 Tax=Spirabiliibacterium mucosae TaxID=28156 RepID=UPI001AAD66D1|nr:iron-containing alcohol dehydrogenase [Spirabiliibacterium mucosae]MBE2898531.1 iron-containing alcohol dehydrogenase [Spirabiliibacterium mucosae]